MRVALRLPNRRKQNPRIVYIHCHIVRAGAVALVEHVFPVFAAIPRAEYAALLIWSKSMAQRRSIDDIWVTRMNLNLSDMPRIA